MLKIESQQLKVAKLDIKSAARGKDGAKYEVRVTLEHEPDSERVLPELQGAVKALLREQAQRADDDGAKDVITIKLKRDLPRCRYELGIFGDNVAGTEGAEVIAFSATKRGKGAVGEPEAKTRVDFMANVVNQPSIAAVHGVLKIRWCVETFLDGPELLALATMVGSDYVAGTVTQSQGELKLDDKGDEGGKAEAQ